MALNLREKCFYLKTPNLKSNYDIKGHYASISLFIILIRDNWLFLAKHFRKGMNSATVKEMQE